MRAVIYTRQSKDAQGTGLAVARQLEACKQLAAARGWEIVGEYSDNDTSATARKRPGFDAAMSAVSGKRADVIIVWAVDRLVRRVSDLESVIDLCEAAGVKLATVSGDLDLSTDQGRLVGRILASVARGEVERKSTRQKLAAQQQAKAGRRNKGCQRPFGYAEDKVTPVPEEADAIREGCRQLLAGGTVSGVRRQWTEAGLRPPQAPFGPLPRQPWNRASVTAILKNPHNAGLRSYHREVVAAGDWEAIVSPETWKAVCAVLGDPSRKVPRGTASLLGGIAVCGTCGSNPVTHSHSQRGHSVYRCIPETRDRSRGPHVAFSAEAADKWVVNAIVDRFSRDDAAGIVTAPGSDIDVTALRDQSMSIRRNLDELAADMVTGIISRSAMIAATERGNARLAEIDAQVAEASREHVAAELITSDDVLADWDKLDISRQRAIVRSLMTVTLHPAGRGIRHPDLNRVVRIEWT
jgi:site-specific DNA recombinase